MTTTSQAPSFNPFADGYFDDPYTHYAPLREEEPVHQSPLGVLMCFAYDGVRQVLLDSRTSMVVDNARASAIRTRSQDPAKRLIPLGLINTDPPHHTRLRRLMAKAFTPRMIDAQTAKIEAHVDSLLGELELQAKETGEPVDLIGGLAFPLPFTVISEMLGMPDGDRSQVRRWAEAVAAASDPIVTKETMVEALAAYRTMSEYISDEVLPWKRSRPGDDVLTALLAAEDDGARLSTAELIDQVTLLYIAGHETTVGLIGNGVLHLLRNRHELERLQAEPGLVGNAIDELNRYDSPIQFGWRIAMADLDVDGTVVPAGQMMLVCIGSANRDPDHFGADADLLDLTRPNAGENLSFGAGIHFCLGAALARREAELTIGELVRRFPGLALAGDAAWNRRIIFRSLESLPVELAT